MYYNPAAFNPRSQYVTTKPRLSKIAKLFVGILLIVVFEGAIRKWISSAFTNPLVLLRDVMAVYGIFWAIQTKRLKFTHLGAQILLLWTVILLAWGLFQLIVGQNSPLIFIIGARFWLLYLWFAYAAAVSLTLHDFNFIGKTIVLLLLVMTPLAVIQHFLPPGAFLNKQLDGDEAGVFTVTANIVRTTGTFSFTAGYAVFLAVATPFVLTLLEPGERYWNRRWMSKFCVLALGIATVVSGSRGAIIFFGIAFATYSTTSLLYSKRSKKISTILVVVGAVVVLALISFVFSGAIDATESRFDTAAQSEDIGDRIFSMFFGEPGTYANFTVFGYGFGAGSNFAGIVGRTEFAFGETEPARIVMEGGLLGFIFIGLKLLVILVGLQKSWVIARLSGKSLPLMLWITTSIALLTWSIIGQLTMNALGYLLLGLAIASLRLSARRS